MDNVTIELKGINQTLQQILDVMKTPESKFKSILEKIVLIAGALGFLHIVELIRQWIMGG